MRQVFLGTPWVHARPDARITHFFNEAGRWMRIPASGALLNGGDRAEIALLLSGLAAFVFTDRKSKHHIFSLILPGRIMGDVDGLSQSVVNVRDVALRDSQVRVVGREDFVAFLDAHPDIGRAHTLGVIADHESDMEGMIANFTLSVAERIAALLHSLVQSAQSEPERGWYRLPCALRAVEIGQIVSVARPTVSSLLARWTRLGLMRRDAGAMYVHERLFAQLYDWTRQAPGPAGGVAKRRHRARKVSAI